jgi:transcriptional regulator with XRE-family HTH domain
VKSKAKSQKSDPLAVSIGRAIADAREQAEVTQVVLARHVGCTPLHVSAIETGHRKPSLDILIAIADALGTGLDVLTGRKP